MTTGGLHSGYQSWCRLHDKPAQSHVLWRADGGPAPQLAPDLGVDGFSEVHTAFVARLVAQTASHQPKHRHTGMVGTILGNVEAMLLSLKQEVVAMATSHHVVVNEKRLPCGLIQVNRAGHASGIARWLAEHLDSAERDLRMVVHHARLPLHRRFRVERQLDRLLKRNRSGPDAPAGHPEVARGLAKEGVAVLGLLLRDPSTFTTRK